MALLNGLDIVAIRKALVHRRIELEAEVQAKLAEARDERISFDTSTATDGGDGASLDASGDLHRAEVARDLAELRDIEAAHQRIAEGTFGICLDCEEAISIERLRVWPTAKRCSACQRAHEKNRPVQATL